MEELIYDMKNQKWNRTQASITVEAALVVPIFFFMLLIFVSFFQIMLVQAEVQRALFDTASFSSQYVYFTETYLKNKKAYGNEKVYESEKAYEDKKESYGYQGTLSEFSEGLMDKALIKTKFLSFVNREFLEHSCIKNGVMGISLLKSKLLENGNDIDIIAVYKINLYSPLIRLPSYTIVQHVKTKAFLGKTMINLEEADAAADDNIKLVYITETGTVYHLSRECTYLNPSIKQILFENVKDARNSNGHKYNSCSSCCKKGEVYTQVYITTWGEGYHSRLDCSGLKRTIREEKLTEAEKQGYHACAKCG